MEARNRMIAVESTDVASDPVEDLWPVASSAASYRIAKLEAAVQRLALENKQLKASIQRLDTVTTHVATPPTARAVGLLTTNVQRNWSCGSELSGGRVGNYSRHAAHPDLVFYPLNTELMVNCGGISPSGGSDLLPTRISSLSSENLDSTSSTTGAPMTDDPTGTLKPSGASSGNGGTGIQMRHDLRRSSLTASSSTATGLGSSGAGVGGMHTPGNHSGTGFLASPRAPRPATIGYELSEDIRAKEIEFMERRYGGRLKCQRAARLIQITYRDYRLRKEYDRIRTEKRVSRRLDTQISTSLLLERSLSLTEGAGAGRAGEGSVEDLVLDQAYLDWRGGTQATDTSVTIKCGKSAGQEEGRSSVLSSGTGAASISPGLISQSRDSGVDATEETSSSSPSASPTSGPSASNSTSSVNSADSGLAHASHPHSLQHLSGGKSGDPAAAATPHPVSPARSVEPGLSPHPRNTHGRHQASKPPHAHVCQHQHRCTMPQHQHPHPHPHSHCHTRTHSQQAAAVTELGVLSPANCLVVQRSSNLAVALASGSGPPATTCSVIGQKHRTNSSVSSSGGSHSGSCCHQSLEKRRKRTYRIGLNFFNKSPLKGIDFLVKHKFVEPTVTAVAQFLISRKGLSRISIGEYLGHTRDEMALGTARQFLREINFKNQEIDVALRNMMAYFHIPGESQKIVHLMEEVQAVYTEQNPAIVGSRFRNPDTVLVLAYAIMMLHTDMYNPNVRQQTKMTREEFVRNLRGVDDGEDIDRSYLIGIYDRIRAEEIKPMPDHTDQVRNIEQHLTGPLRPTQLVQPYRRLVCYCRLFDVPDITKPQRVGAHQRDVFLFNDTLLVTKALQKKREGFFYQVRSVVPLCGVQVYLFDTPAYPCGIQVKRLLDDRVLATFNTKSLSDRERFVEDLQECVLEMNEMDRIRIDDELVKQQRQQQQQGQSQQQQQQQQYNDQQRKLSAHSCPLETPTPTPPRKQSLNVMPGESHSSGAIGGNLSTQHQYHHRSSSGGGARLAAGIVSCTAQQQHQQHHSDVANCCACSCDAGR